MSGSTTTFATIRTKPVTITATLGNVALTTVEINNIQGNFTYYNLVRDTSGESIVRNHLTSSTIYDTNLKPGNYYYYTFYPFFEASNGFTYAGNSYLIRATTYESKITSASFGQITRYSVEIQDISGIFDYFSIIRTGVNSKAYVDLTLNQYRNFTDYDARFYAGATYNYSIIPNVVDTQTGQKIDGETYIVGPVVIPP